MLGARLGTEVRALMELGHLAVGVDLNPGAANQYVLHGDFHHLVFPDRSFSAVYTNTLDHVFDLPRLVDEIRRVLVPGGVLIADVVPGFDEGHLPGDPSIDLLDQRRCAGGSPDGGRHADGVASSHSTASPGNRSS